MTELAYETDLKSVGHKDRVGSSPTRHTNAYGLKQRITSKILVA